MTKISRERWQSICLESFIKEQQGFVFRGNIIFLTVDFGMNHSKPFLFFPKFSGFSIQLSLAFLAGFLLHMCPKGRIWQ